MIARLKRLFRYDNWANRESLDAASTPRALALMGHVLGTEWLWLSRLRGVPSPVPVWPDWDAGRCGTEAGTLPREWDLFLEETGEEGLARAIEYTNSQGERWSSTVEDVLLHVVMHSVYHRGQAAAHVRANGGTPAYTDFIHAVRTRRIS